MFTGDRNQLKCVLDSIFAPLDSYICTLDASFALIVLKFCSLGFTVLTLIHYTALRDAIYALSDATHCSAL